MRLINVKAFIERERAIGERRRLVRRSKVLEFRDDEVTTYAILSHRWIEQQGETTEVDYDEMIGLEKMEKVEQDQLRSRLGYQKILNSCKQAVRDGYEWLWVDTCCIDKRSSAELSEAINSMYRWYENSSVCYAYLHDVRCSSFPTVRDEGFSNSHGWPEWFTRGWTLQEMIAPGNVQFFNKYWQHIGDKRTLAHTLSDITRVPHHILTDGLSSNRPCVAQIMSWAADRTTTRIEDKAYSLMGLLDVNMPMLYGEGKRAFHRLQLEIIRMSNDQSIFAWGFSEDNGRTGSILADDPSCFRGCNRMELMDPNEFIQFLKHDIVSEGELPSVEEDQLGIFPITNRGIQIWLFLHPCVNSDSVFAAWLPCRCGPLFPPVLIHLALWKTNYHRYFTSLCGGFPMERTLQVQQLYLRYQDIPHRDTTFEIDDSAMRENGLTYCGTFPSKLSGNTLTLTGIDPLCVKVYSDSQASCRVAVGIGQCFGQDWIHFVSEVPASGLSWERYAREVYKEMLVRGPEHGQSMIEIRSRGERYYHVWIKYTSLLGSTWTVRTSCVVWESSRNCGVKFEVFQCPPRNEHEWIGFDVEVSHFCLISSTFILLSSLGNQ